MKKIVCISFVVFFLSCKISGVSAQDGVKFDILLKGGHIIDPANNINSVMDVAVARGRIALVDKNIPADASNKVVDVSGYYVTPGFVDIHTHVFHTFDLPGRWIIADHHSFLSGVTTVVDAGTSGADNFEDFKNIIDGSRTRILAFLNIAATGKNEGQDDPSKFSVQHAVETAKRYPDIIVGFKSCDYWYEKPFDEAHPPWASVDSVLAAGRKAGLPVMISFSTRQRQKDYPERSYHEFIQKKLRPGDIHTCLFSPYIPVIREDGKLNPDIIEAQKRGVIFDGAHGAGSFLYRNAVSAFKQGFVPNTISTDLHGAGRTTTAISMLHVMSNYLAMGIPLEDVIKCSTINPARAINHPELGSLSTGSTADIAVIEVINGNISYLDTGGGKIKGNKELRSIMTIFGGKIVFDPYGISFPEWETIPKDSDYWVNPSGQNW